MLRSRPRLLPTIVGLLVLLVLVPASAAPASAAPASAGATAATKTVRFHGYKLRVPAAWPVYNLAADPTVCVRFNRHAVYLGQPSTRQVCPARAIGRTEAILVTPLTAHGARAGTGSGPALPSVTNPRAEPNGTQFAVPSADVLVTATWHRDPTVLKRALGVHRLPAPQTATAAPAHPSQVRPRATHRAGDPLYTGPGFDVCSTPSTSTMSAWSASPYRAIGVYIGGANEACSQPNMSPAWVAQQSAAGWVLLPIYVGLQAPRNGCGCAAIDPTQAAAEGTAAADDAVNQAAAQGISPGNPIYDDMEAYSRTASNTSAVLAFLGAWTTELHAHGYLSGIYSSATSGVSDLVAQVGTGFPEPDEIWNAEWNNQANTTSAYIPSGDWANHQRLHQYQGGHNATYGGATLNIDSDYVDAGGAAGGALFPDGTFVQVSGSPYFWEIAGGAPMFVSDWSTVGGAQPYTVITQQQFNLLNPVPANGTFVETNTGAVFRVAGGAPMYVTTPALLGTSVPVRIDEWNIDNVGNPMSHLNAAPSNGTFVTNATTGVTYRIAGGAPIAASSWAPFGGVQPTVAIDPWDISNTSNPLSRLIARPAVGTLVEGLPSAAYWRFGPKNRYLVTATSGAVRVDDRGLAPFSAIPCRVPGLTHLTLTQVKAALLKADCHLGKVHQHLVSRRRHTLRVIKQVPAARTKHAAYYTVGITVG